ncbi:DUF1690-domain-containing protein [Myriangium duriaei CBS 260.36]|uniref:DUF1690-domain-containing protein n=1 Tax=Myriangium duriaei CBS 260.36 TaxID=1168546 RepID=A0A9P4MDR8_9PEZI|nr:DUF1690-domain-containing protein [Myriangium duriaei CBS 260.36]
MGSGGSKSAGDPSSHVFSAETPVRFSQQVLDSLQGSSETDSTRARAQEQHIQARVQAELAKIRDTEGARLQSLLADLTPSEESDDKAQSEGVVSKLTGGSSAGVDRTHDSVKKEIEGLKAKLEERRKLEKPTGEVEKAKESLVQCLRMNDRRPLDCWREVEEFKNEVARLERGFVERTMR